MRVWTAGMERRNDGQPAVILEAGAGEGLDNWKPVFGQTASIVFRSPRFWTQRHETAHGPGHDRRLAMSLRPLVVAIGIIGTIAACARSERPPGDVDTARIVAADDEPGNWLTHGRTYSEQRYSPLRAHRHREREAARSRLVIRPRDEPRGRGDAARRRWRDVRHVGLEHRARDRRAIGRPRFGCTIRRWIAPSAPRPAAMS